MEVLKTTSCLSLIQSCGTRFRIKDTNWHSDAIEWIGEAARAIGYHTGFETKDIDVKIKDYKGKFPAEAETLNFIYYNNLPLPIAHDRQDLLLPSVKSNLNVLTYPQVLDLNKEVDRLKALQVMYAATPTTTILDAITNASNKVSAMISNIGLGAASNYYDGDYYSIDGGYIKTSFSDGTVKVNANCFILDVEGYPMVIDTYKYRMCCEWNIMANLCLQGYTHPEINWRIADAKFDDFRQQASNEAKVLGRDQMDRFYERWSSVYRDIQGVHVIGSI